MSEDVIPIMIYLIVKLKIDLTIKQLFLGDKRPINWNSVFLKLLFRNLRERDQNILPIIAIGFNYKGFLAFAYVALNFHSSFLFKRITLKCRQM